MSRSFRFIGKLSLVILIFFSLQGEVMTRYFDLFQGKLENRTHVPQKTAERQQLIKLQCYTQKFFVVSLPVDGSFTFSLVVVTIPKISYVDTGSQLIRSGISEPPSLRGPPLCG